MKSLILDHQHVPFDKLLPKIDKDVTYLSMNNCALTSIVNFPVMPNLTKLDLMDNKLTDLSPLTDCSLLERLDLSNNQKLTLDSLKPLLRLKYLNLLTALTDSEEKRSLIFSMLPSLVFLDFKSEDGEEVEYSSGEEEEDSEDYESDENTPDSNTPDSQDEEEEEDLEDELDDVSLDY